ncbi:glutathione S-transferase [Pelagibius sp. Alg239-R121]|uniref:glutathione S-transferase n=1 Tax=Pelagibius sp. Alg239-R121 TaxID=2993448 RepID=UPI0024A78682|nr:glutathione S-transferase family protein [Pelagibius sp. Alg239-R121]
MNQKLPKLISFAISHYCEKARWALDWYGIEYTEEFWPIGLHMRMTRELGVPKSCVPILMLDGEILQGSREILDWAYVNRTDSEKSLEDSKHGEEIREIEARADDVVGVEVRRLLYAQTLTQHPDIVLELLYGNLDSKVRSVGHNLWPKIQPAMIQTLDAAPDAVADSRAKLDVELDWLDEKLAEGKHHLVGDRLTRADLAAASLLAPFAQLSRERMYRRVEVPPEIEEEFERLKDRPSMKWVADTYRDFR